MNEQPKRIEQSKKALLDWHARLLAEAYKPQSIVLLQSGDAQRLVDDLLDAAMSLAEQGRIEEGWQPIETAPKDGTWTLLWWPHWHHAPMIGYYDNFGWRCDRALSEDGVGPLAWHPLPAPPKQEEGQP